MKTHLILGAGLLAASFANPVRAQDRHEERHVIELEDGDEGLEMFEHGFKLELNDDDDDDDDRDRKEKRPRFRILKRERDDREDDRDERREPRREKKRVERRVERRDDRHHDDRHHDGLDQLPPEKRALILKHVEELLRKHHEKLAPGKPGAKVEKRVIILDGDKKGHFGEKGLLEKGLFEKGQKGLFLEKGEKGPTIEKRFVFVQPGVEPKVITPLEGLHGKKGVFTVPAVPGTPLTPATPHVIPHVTPHVFPAPAPAQRSATEAKAAKLVERLEDLVDKLERLVDDLERDAQRRRR